MRAEPTPDRAGDGTLTTASARGRWVLTATVLGSALAQIDATVVGIALPAVGREFGAPLETLQWVVTGYTLTLSGLILVAGALGDRYGRRRVFQLGVAWFAAASLLCAVAPSAPALVVARALQGVGGALLTPGSLAILQASFRPADRGRAIGAWTSLGGVASAVGPFVGGWLLGVGSWRLIFAINLPLAALVLLIAHRHVPESRDPQAPAHVDALGGLLVTAGLMGVTYGLIATRADAVLAGVALVAAFVVRQARVPFPLLPLRLFASRTFTATNAVTFVVYGALGGTLFLLPLQLQQVCGYTPLQAGISLLPITVVMLLLSARSGALAARIGPRLQLTVGPVVVGAGMALLTRVDERGGYVTHVLPAVAVVGLGLAIAVAPLTATVLAAAPTRLAGMASAVNNDVARVAGLIAVAVLPATVGLSGAAYLDAARFSDGFHRAALLGAALCVVGGLLSLGFVRESPSRPPGR